jgi:hypothetical protein
LERILGSEAFRSNGLDGAWRSDEAELEFSQSQFKEFFYLMRDDDEPYMSGTFKIKHYHDLLAQNFQDEGLRTPITMPYFLSSVNLQSAENPPRQMLIDNEFDLSDSMIITSISKRAFRSQPASRSFLTLGETTKKDCDFTLAFSVYDRYMSMVIGDTKDVCLPFLIDGDLDFDETEQEEFENMVDKELFDPTTGDSSSKSSKQAQAKYD